MWQDILALMYPSQGLQAGSVMALLCFLLRLGLMLVIGHPLTTEDLPVELGSD